MHQQFERPARVFLCQNIGHHIVGLARVDHQRQADLARRLDVLPEHRRLHVARAEIIVEVEAAFADAHHAGTLGQRHKIGRRHGRVVFRFMRMGADGAPDVGVRHGQGVGGLKGRQLVRYFDHQADSGGAGPVDDGVAVLVELRRVQIDVAVDQHQPRVRARSASAP